MGVLVGATVVDNYHQLARVINTGMLLTFMSVTMVLNDNDLNHKNGFSSMVPTSGKPMGPPERFSYYEFGMGVHDASYYYILGLPMCEIFSYLATS